MRYIFLTILSVLAAFILFFFALIYINIDVGIILPMHFWLSRKQKRKSKAR